MRHTLLLVLLVMMHTQVTVVQDIHRILQLRRMYPQHRTNICITFFLNVVAFVVIFVVQRRLFARTVRIHPVRRTFMCGSYHLFLLVLESLLPPEVATILEHISRVWVQAPE